MAVVILLVIPIPLTVRQSTRPVKPNQLSGEKISAPEPLHCVIRTAVILGTVLAIAATAQTVTVQDLGSLGGASAGLAINNRGQVTGYSTPTGITDKHAFIKPAGLVMSDLNFYTTFTSATSYGYAINAKGAIVGSIDPQTHNLPVAFVWDGASPTLTTLGTLGGGMSEALGINSGGQITGWGSLIDGKSHAFVRPGTALIDLGVLPGGQYSSGTSINNAGQVTGWSYTAGATKPRAFLYNPGKALVDLGQGLDSSGNAINSLGHVAGQWAGHAAVYTPRTGLGRVPGLDDVISDAKSINSLGQVVGVYSSAGATNVYVYSPGGTATDLNGLLPPNSGWQIKTAWSINNVGQITGEGLFSGTSHAYILNLPRCDVSFPVTSGQFGAFGGAGTLIVNSHAADCNFPAVASTDWVGVGTPAGSGTRLVPFTIGINSGTETRTATITVANRAFYILQQGMQIPVPKYVDVLVSHPFFDYVKTLAAAQITAGCVAMPAQYCPDGLTTRGQMAVFLTRALTGGDTFPYSSTPYFEDVPATHPFFKHIQKMKELGLTSGCSAKPVLYCPDAPVTRGQMAVFIVRALTGDDFEYGSMPYFQDVAPSDPWFSYIQKLRDLGITSGCSSASYCADQPTTRGQMAAFLVRAFLTTRAN